MNTPQLRYNTLIYQPSGSGSNLVQQLQEISFFEVIHTTYSYTQVLHALSVMKVDALLLPMSTSQFHLGQLRQAYPQVALILYGGESEQISSGLFDLIEDVVSVPARTSNLHFTLSRLSKFFERNKVELSEESVSKGDRLKVKEGHFTHILNAGDVKYIESFGEYVKYHAHPKCYLSLASLKKLNEVLPKCYVQVHRSYIVNTSFITSVSNTSIQLVGGVQIPIGRTYKSVIKGLIL